jgi:hypothetical protein
VPRHRFGPPQSPPPWRRTPLGSFSM